MKLRYKQHETTPPTIENFAESLGGLHTSVEKGLLLSTGFPNREVFENIKKYLNPELQSWEQWSLFVNKSILLANKIGVEPNDLLWLISFESYTVKNPRRYFDTGYHNAVGDIAGLLSFRESGVKIEAFAILLGKESKSDVELEDIVGLDALKQLDFIEAYLQHWIDIKNLTTPISFSDLYLLIWSPKYLGVPDEEVVAAGEGSDYIADIDKQIVALQDCAEDEIIQNQMKIDALQEHKKNMIDRYNKNSGWDRESTKGHINEVQKRELTTKLIYDKNMQHHKRAYVTESK